MAVLRCDAGPEGLSLGRETLGRRLRSVPRSAPIVIMVHGYKFSPFVPHADPHRHILSPAPYRRSWKAVSWPKAMGFVGGLSDGLCIAFGWHARGSIWQAWQEAEAAGDALAALTERVALAAGRPVDLVAHSLGVRVCMRALAQVPGSPVGRMILMNGAEFRQTAARAMTTKAGQGAEVFNIVSRENDPFDALIERVMPAPHPGDRALGAGLVAKNWLDIQIDAPPVLRAFSRFGLAVSEAPGRICHWSAYARPGLLPFYARLLRERERLSFDLLRQSVPRSCEPRWTRLQLGLPRHALSWPGLWPMGASGTSS